MNLSEMTYSSRHNIAQKGQNGHFGVKHERILSSASLMEIKQTQTISQNMYLKYSRSATKAIIIIMHKYNYISQVLITARWRRYRNRSTQLACVCQRDFGRLLCSLFSKTLVCEDLMLTGMLMGSYKRKFFCGQVSQEEYVRVVSHQK